MRQVDHVARGHAQGERQNTLAHTRKRLVDEVACKRYDDGIQINDSARKHGIQDADIFHALDNMIRYAEQEYDGELRVFIIGADRSGRLLELVVVPADNPQRIIHADVLRPSRYDFL